MDDQPDHVILHAMLCCSTCLTNFFVTISKLKLQIHESFLPNPPCSQVKPKVKNLSFHCYSCHDWKTSLPKFVLFVRILYYQNGSRRWCYCQRCYSISSTYPFASFFIGENIPFLSIFWDFDHIWILASTLIPLLSSFCEIYQVWILATRMRSFCLNFLKEKKMTLI